MCIYDEYDNVQNDAINEQEIGAVDTSGIDFEKLDIRSQHHQRSPSKSPNKSKHRNKSKHK